MASIASASSHPAQLFIWIPFQREPKMLIMQQISVRILLAFFADKNLFPESAYQY